MAYNTQLLSRINTGIFDGSWNIWQYRSADTFATVKAANFFTDAVAKGMKVRDLVVIVDTATPATTLANILTVPAAGATMSQTGVVVAE
jgi:hypothetical protein